MPDDEKSGAVFICGTSPRDNSDDWPQVACKKCGCSICPKCGGHCSQGYGLAFGGIGPYEACNDCDYFYKGQDADAG